MTLTTIAILSLLALAGGRLKRARGLVLLTASVFVLYWLQPNSGQGSLAFWLPTATLILMIITWALVTDGEARAWNKNWPALAILALAIVIIDLNRYANLDWIFPVLNPRPMVVVSFIIAIAILLYGIDRWQRLGSILLGLAPLGLVLLFIILKIPGLAEKGATGLSLAPTGETNPSFIISWLGFSYIAFRLLHTIRDRQSGRLPAVTLEEYANYVIFFQALSAGPIDRLERFAGDLRNPLPLDDPGLLEAGKRLFGGLAKKFIFADMLALISLDDKVAGLLEPSAWAWFFLYTYSLRIYFDFSGYTDIAIGLARLAGIRLPENFSAPYLKPNLTLFWNSWHMTLTQWFRAYFFNPLTRSLRSARRPLPAWGVILLTQVLTMLLIGLWHGITWNYALWGLWHGLGLFVQNRWSDFMRTHPQPWMSHKLAAPILNGVGIVLTFNFVSLGWLFFSLSTPELAWDMLKKLFWIG